MFLKTRKSLLLIFNSEKFVKFAAVCNLHVFFSLAMLVSTVNKRNYGGNEACALKAFHHPRIIASSELETRLMPGPVCFSPFFSARVLRLFVFNLY